MGTEEFISQCEAALLACETSDAAFEIIADAFAHFGFTEMFYTYAALKYAPGTRNGVKIDAIKIMYHNMPEEAVRFYEQDYNKDRLFEDDPGVAHFALLEGRAFVSGLSYVELGMQAVTPRQERFLRQANQHLGAAAIIVPVVTPEFKHLPSGALTGWSRMRGEELKKHTALIQKYIPRLVDVFVRDIIPLTADLVGRDIKMTRREKECLQLISDGLRPADIAEKLNISTSMVNRHIGSARIKLRARTLPHAIARGVALKLIHA